MKISNYLNLFLLFIRFVVSLFFFFDKNTEPKNKLLHHIPTLRRTLNNCSRHSEHPAKTTPNLEIRDSPIHAHRQLSIKQLNSPGKNHSNEYQWKRNALFVLFSLSLSYALQQGTAPYNIHKRQFALYVQLMSIIYSKSII